MTTTCTAAALVPATETSPAHVHACNRYLFADGSTHVGMHQCGSCGSSFTVGPASAPTATEKCEACGAIQPLTHLREMYPEPDVTQYLCLDTAACSARVKGQQTLTPGDVHELRSGLPELPPLVELGPLLATTHAVEGLAGAIQLVREARDAADDLPRGAVGRTTLQRVLRQLERALLDYRPPEATLETLHVEPGVAEQVKELGERVTELERAVANLIERRPQVDQLGRCLSRVGDHQCIRPYGHGGLCTEGAEPAAPYVHRLLDAYLTGGALNFAGEHVPLDVQRRLEVARPGRRHLIAVRTSDGRKYAPADVELVYGP